MTASDQSTRRTFLKQTVLATAASPLLSAIAPAAETGNRPNILLVISDQYRWDFIHANGQNPTDFTPNLDAMVRRGTTFEHAYTNQPLCSPARSCLFTGQYATTTGIWKLTGPGIGLRADAVTLGTLLSSAGYSTNYIGKWHLMEINNKADQGYVPPEKRGGFTGLWQASNVLEQTSHPYHGTMWDRDGTPMNFEGIYRVEFLTDLAVNFLRQKQDKPFFLVLSQLEPHQQNDLNGFAPPKGYAEKFSNPFVPPDLRLFPGDWPFQLANYYGDCKSIDESMGEIFQTLREQNLEDNTIVIFLSDHGCHFRTRNTEYKRSPHDSSIHIPLIIQGPGFNGGRKISEMVSLVDVAPTLLDVLGLTIPSAMQGHSFLPLINDPNARATWRNEIFIQTSESEIARAIRTPEWTYVALAPDANSRKTGGSMTYRDYQLYNNTTDPAQIVNLAGRADPPRLLHYGGGRSMRKITEDLRERLLARMEEAGEPRPEISQWDFYP
ncbi:MAG TPA: sulfatase-like hydrolase/transferase [Candidatus Sulfotelmatobacter sp.]|nr:sulfatase-like hydrolase/transferase [Candidatus Sulfotelmatobacter sp.]